MSNDWYLMTNKYLSGYEKEEFEKTYGVFNEILSQSPEAYEVTINNIPKTVIIQSDTDPHKRKILFENGDVEHGDLVEFDGLKWLVTDFPYNNKIYVKSVMHLCNEVLKFEEQTEETIIGYDSLNRPIYKSTSITHEIPCVLQNIAEYNADNQNQPINMTEAETTLMIPYPSHELVKLGLEFELYGEEHMVIGVDKRKIVQNRGCLVLIAQKT